MRTTRRLITVIVGCAAWCVAAATVASAQIPADGSGSGGGISVVSVPTSTGTPIWEFVATAALGAFLTLAVLGLVFSRRSSRRSEPALHS
jgi:MYXO-CTERM domain-containing protein